MPSRLLRRQFFPNPNKGPTGNPFLCFFSPTSCNPDKATTPLLPASPTTSTHTTTSSTEHIAVPPSTPTQAAELTSAPPATTPTAALPDSQTQATAAPTTNPSTPSPTAQATPTENNTSSGEATATTAAATASSPATSLEGATTATILSTAPNGIVNRETITINSDVVPFTTVSGTPFISITNSAGFAITVPFGQDPKQTSTSGGASSPSAASASAAAGRSSNVGAIAGGVIGALAFIFLIIAFFLFRRRRQRALRTAPSSEFLARRQYPFSGSTQFHFQRAGSYGSNDGSVLDIAHPGTPLSREAGPRTYDVAGEKMGLV